MSHGPPGGGGVDPNLTPLLDLVMQLLMFFMICANFSGAANNEPVNLADSQTAKMPDDETSTQPGGGSDFLFLTVKPFTAGEFGSRFPGVLDKFKEGEPCVVIVGEEPMKMVDNFQVKVWLEKQFDDTKRSSKDGQVHTAIVIRPAGEIDYAIIYRILKYCKDAGFTKLNVRAQIGKVGA